MSSARQPPLVLDPKLLPRVLAYLEANDEQKAGEARVQVEDIVCHLRNKHPEYSRKPYKAFLKQVSRVCEQQRARAERETAGGREASGGVVEAGDGDKAMDVAEDDDDVEVIEAEDRNLVNSSMRALYRTPTKPAATSLTQPTTTLLTAVPAPATQLTATASAPCTVESLPSSSALSSVNPKKRKTYRNSHSSHPPATSQHTSPFSPSDSWQPTFISPHLSYSDLGGLSPTLQDLRELIHYPLLHPELYSHLGLSPPSGVLLHGPAGCGQPCSAAPSTAISRY